MKQPRGSRRPIISSKPSKTAISEIDVGGAQSVEVCREGQCTTLLVDDEAIVRKTIGDYLRDAGHRVDMAENGLEAHELIERKEYDLILLDLRMPRKGGMELLKMIRKVHPETPVVIISGHGSMESVIEALRLGATDFLNKPVKLLDLDAVLKKSVMIRNLRLERRRLNSTVRGMQDLDDLRTGNRTLIGSSPQTEGVRRLITQVAEARCDTILLTGETGTGKEVVAREIHTLTRSNESPFVAVCCPALAETLLESALFGHVKGAFTGADNDREGYFEMADGGTLFLDEVADLSAQAQASLLRVLETRRLRRVGGDREISVDVRVVAATNASLEDLIEQGKFRQDLYYRLNIFSIQLSPLRDRRQDIIPLARHFLKVYATSRGIPPGEFSAEVTQQLEQYPFPGNARELRNLVERAAILARNGTIEAEHLNLCTSPGHNSACSNDNNIDSDSDQQDQGQGVPHERDLILQTLEAARWNRRETARSLNMPYSTLRYKIVKYNIQ